MRRLLSLVLSCVVLLSPAAVTLAEAQSESIVISEFRVRGPNGGNDEFVELFNASPGPIDISGWLLRGSNAAGTVGTRATVPAGVVLGSGCFYLFTNSNATAGPYSGAVPGDQTFSTGITDDGGVAIALPDTTIVDQVGLSNGSAFKEGTPLASLGSTSASNLDRGYARSPTPGTDTDDNAADFVLIQPSDPQNRASVPGCLAFEAVEGEAVISQVYGGGGNSGALYTHDFIELFNRSDVPVNLAGWSVQYASATGSTWQVTSLSGMLPPGAYLLVQQAAGANPGTPLPTPDVTGTTAMAATAGKVALVRSTAALSGACPQTSDIADFVGYGTSANCFEGSAPAPMPSTSSAAANTSTVRAEEGCRDTDDNASDFFTRTPPTPRNSASPTRDCTAAFLFIHEIQGSGITSPVVGQIVKTRGVVTARRSNGFNLQTLPEEEDGDPATSEGLLIFTGSTPPASAVPGAVLEVRGTIVEFVPAADPHSPSLTEMVGPTVTAVLGTAGLPDPVVLTPDLVAPDGGLFNLEHLEGMRVHVPSLAAVGPTLGGINEISATGFSNGVFYGVLTGEPRPFREPGIQAPAPPPPCAAHPDCAIPIFDNNPERLRIVSLGQAGSTAITVAAGATIANLTGVLDYGFRTWTIMPDPDPPPVVVDTAAGTGAPPPSPGTFTVASFNLQRLFDDVNDPGINEPVLTPEAFQRRLGKISLVVREYLHSPDVIGVQEVENLSTLQRLADRINADAVAAGDPDPGYTAYLEEGNDIGGIDVGALVAGRVAVHDFTQWGKDATFIDPNTGQPAILNDRPSISLRATVDGAALDELPAEVIVVVSHLRSLIGIASATDGERVRAKRAAQAEFLAQVHQDLQTTFPLTPVISLGDFNAFEVNDGYVHTLGILRGQPAPPQEVAIFVPDLVEPDFALASETLPPGERYSFVFDGNAQSLDHVLVSASGATTFTGFSYARINADFPVVLFGDGTRPERVSDHDPGVAYFRYPADTVPPVITSLQPSVTTLWPPNHRMVPVTLAVEAFDNRHLAGCAVTNVDSSEPANGVGDGHTAVDWTIDGPLAVSLRAERSGTGDGRIYTITVTCEDAAGNAAVDAATVLVPRSARP